MINLIFEAPPAWINCREDSVRIMRIVRFRWEERACRIRGRVIVATEPVAAMRRWWVLSLKKSEARKGFEVVSSLNMVDSESKYINEELNDIGFLNFRLYINSVELKVIGVFIGQLRVLIGQSPTTSSTAISSENTGRHISKQHQQNVPHTPNNNIGLPTSNPTSL